MGTLRLLALVIAGALGAVQAGEALAQPEKRVALVIGNSSYRHVPSLANPASDARLVADTLRTLGFTLIGGAAHFDLEKPAFDAAVQTFGGELRAAEVGLFYYAGHGLQICGTNYLVPIGANPSREADVDFQMVDTSVVLRQMEGSGTRLNLVILDACRNNPFGERGLRSAARGLAQMQAPEGTLISFATQPGNVALDGPGRNSPFTEALVATMRLPGLGLFDAFNAVGLAVKTATAGAQQPWLSSSPIVGTFYFAGRPVGLGAAATSGAQSGPPIAADEVFWLTIRDSRVAALFEEFLSRFPSSSHVAEARARLAELQTAKIAAAAVPDKPKDVVAAPVTFEAVRRALPKDIPVSDALLRTVLNNPLFAGAPPMRITRFRSDDGGKGEWSTDCKVRSLGGHLSQDNCTENTKGVAQTTISLFAANGLVDLGWRQGTSKGQQNLIKRIEPMSGRIFPLTPGNRFAYRAVTTSPGGSDDLIREYSCEVGQRRPAAQFHAGLVGDAFIVACEQLAMWPKKGVQMTQKDTKVFLQELGAALPIDSIDPAHLRAGPDAVTLLKDFELAR